MRRTSVLIAVLALLATGCSDPADDRVSPRRRASRRPPAVATALPSVPAVTPGATLLATSFERPICGRYQHPGPGCEFGYEGDDLETGPFRCRTGPRCLRINRVSHSHMGVIREVPLPGGHAFVGAGHRIPEIPDGAVPTSRGYLELFQLSPTDGSPDVLGYPVEVRLYPDRRLGLALYREKDEVVTRVPVPVDEWFSTVVEVTNGIGATQRLWVFDGDGNAIDSVQIDLDSSRQWPHSERTAQKLGGATSALEEFDTYHDDWWIAESFLGPVRIDPHGAVIR